MDDFLNLAHQYTVQIGATIGAIMATITVMLKPWRYRAQVIETAKQEALAERNREIGQIKSEIQKAITPLCRKLDSLTEVQQKHDERQDRFEQQMGTAITVVTQRQAEIGRVVGINYND